MCPKITTFLIKIYHSCSKENIQNFRYPPSWWQRQNQKQNLECHTWLMLRCLLLHKLHGLQMYIPERPLKKKVCTYIIKKPLKLFLWKMTIYKADVYKIFPLYSLCVPVWMVFKKIIPLLAVFEMKYSSPFPLTQLNTWTKSVTKLGTSHFIKAELPIITYTSLALVV